MLRSVDILPDHTERTQDGTPVLRSIPGKRARYCLNAVASKPTAAQSAPWNTVDEPSVASLSSNTSTATLLADTLNSKHLDGFTLLREPQSKFTCVACASLLSEPLRLPCAHSICSECSPKHSDVGICPNCSHQYAVQSLMPDSMLAWLINHLPMKCTDCDFVCGRQQVAEMASHRLQCSNVLVACPHAVLGCKERVARHSLDEHLSSCKFQPFASFMTSTLRRLEALEEENRRQRADLRSAAVRLRWLEANMPQLCTDCQNLFYPDHQVDCHLPDLSERDRCSRAKDVCRHTLDQAWAAGWRHRKRRFLVDYQTKSSPLLNKAANRAFCASSTSDSTS